MQIKDLNIQEIANLFNFTQNDDAKAVLHSLITLPLQTKEEVIAQYAKAFVIIFNVWRIPRILFNQKDSGEIHLNA